MAANIRLHSFATRLLLTLLSLVVLTALSTSIPAYWLTRRQLEEQAWKNVSNAQQATLSLLQAETTRLNNLASLLTERPTLQRFVQEMRVAELPDYLQDFQERSDLDVLYLCQNGRLLAGKIYEPPICLESIPDGFGLLNGRPALLASQTVPGTTTTAIVGLWLDSAFLQQLAAATGAGQSILLDNGVRLASSLAGDVETAVIPLVNLETELLINGNPYFATYSQLSQSPPLVSEVALPVSTLKTAENQALLALAVSMALVAILAGLLGSWTVRQLVAPLQKLTDVADQISGGDWMVPIPLFAAPTEISRLASALHKSQSSMLQTLAERSEAYDWLNTVIQSIVEGVVTLDGYGRITFFSQGAETLTGWSADEAFGAPANEVFTLVEPGNRPFLDLLPAMGGKRQIAIRARSGKNNVLAVTGARLKALNTDSTQVAARVVLVLHDVTQEEALRHLRSYFLANISHEFRTPLSTLQASMELLLDEKEELSASEMREIVKPSYLSLASLRTLIDNLLESSQIEGGQFVIRVRPFSINDAINDALNIVRPLFERRQQSVLWPEAEALPDIGADPARLTQVLVNLLTNASKYSPNGAAIGITVIQTENILHVSVSDEGPGIPPAEQANLFHRFVRLDSVDREQYGIGLGLYVVKTVVEAHNGRVGINERPEGGSTFWFELPLSKM
jgi:PAS domain S-box-containing protein